MVHAKQSPPAASAVSPDLQGRLEQGTHAPGALRTLLSPEAIMASDVLITHCHFAVLAVEGKAIWQMYLTNDREKIHFPNTSSLRLA